MQNRTLGRTGLQVSPVGLGGLFVSSFGGAFEQGRQAILRAIELGINYVDTAPTYGNSEEVLGRVLPEIEAPLVVSTKLGGRPEPFNPRDKASLRRSLEMSLDALKRDQVDILMIHEPDRPRQYDWWTDWARVQGPVLEVLQELKSEGLIRFTGLGGTTVYEMAHLLKEGDFDVVLTAFNYSLLWREAGHGVLPIAREKNMGIIIGSPLQQGALARQHPEVEDETSFLSAPRRAQFRALYALVDEAQIALPEMAMRWVLSNPDISCVLTGSRSPEEVESNVTAAKAGPLSPELLARLDEIAAMVPFRPCAEPMSLPFGRTYAGAGMLI